MQRLPDDAQVAAIARVQAMAKTQSMCERVAGVIERSTGVPYSAYAIASSPSMTSAACAVPASTYYFLSCRFASAH